MINVEFDQADLQRQLRELEEGLQGKAIRAGLTQAIKPLLADMKSKVPVGDEGALKRSLGRTTLSKRAKGRLGIPVSSVAILIGPNRKVQDGQTKRHQGYKAIWQEYGTKSMTANPFLGPAYDANIGQVETNFFQGLQTYINKVSQ